MGPVIIDVNAFELDAVEREILQHPLVGGLILFSRNYADIHQLKALIKDIRKTVNKPFLISVDHEGGRVQRFHESFTRIPAMADVKKIADSGMQPIVPVDREYQALSSDTSQATLSAFSMGYVMAAELLTCDIDISFAPVLDLERGSQVIGSRAFSSEPKQAVEWAGAYIDGMHDAGMKCTGKHFPGHGSVLEDSHIAMPVDNRTLTQIQNTDMSVFVDLIKQHKLNAVMPAHVIYEQVDNLPAGFSNVWLQDVLRHSLKFDGVIFSDDLSMEAATAIKCVVERSERALAAGCDMILVCNAPDKAIAVLDGLKVNDYEEHAKRALHLLIDENVRKQIGKAKFQTHLTQHQRHIYSLTECIKRL